MRLRSGQLLALTAALPLLVVIGSLAVAGVTLIHQSRLRHQLVVVVGPAGGAAQALTTAMVNQETGIRGYELTGRRVFLQPYAFGRREEATDIAELRRAHVPGTAGALALAVRRIDEWETRTARPALRRSGHQRGRTVTTIDTDLAGKHEFDDIRAALGALRGRLSTRVSQAKQSLNTSAHDTAITLVVIGVVLLLALAGADILRVRLFERPLGRLAAGTRRVADGALEHPISIGGPVDIERLGADVDAMRVRLVAELGAISTARNELAILAGELERSNAELEQFAYVASHDLQEPLRKVTSFVQLLQARYEGQLDEKADEYIGYAVDGAGRMGQLINDLLAFSRVGRSRDARRETDLGRLAASAVADLEPAIAAAGATVEIGELPQLAVVPSLIRTVLQNLFANAIKFHGDDPPFVALEARRRRDAWWFTCTDNGIGIESEYADRVFVIFQRLHPRERYAGTGIGLAMCRKIVEYHGGQIWIDTDYAEGTRICFTLPPFSVDSETMARS